MRTIIVENVIYKVSEKEFKKVKILEQEIKDSASDYKACFAAENRLFEYLDANTDKYKYIGEVDFHCQR